MTSREETPKAPAKTAVYIDGYNLYYGHLRGTAFKWLDVVALFDNLLIQRDQNERLCRAHLFTAPALANFATNGSVLSITNTPGAVINWQGFSIGANETVNFNQPSSAAATPSSMPDTVAEVPTAIHAASRGCHGRRRSVSAI